MPTNVPKGRFDLMLTLPDAPEGSVAKGHSTEVRFHRRRETREADVLVLKVKDPRLLALHVSKPGSKVDFKHDYKQSKSVEAFARFPHRHGNANTGGSFLQTGDCADPNCPTNYDLTFQWDNAQGKEAQTRREQALSEQLAQAGLELVPSREPIEMLVVEKVK